MPPIIVTEFRLSCLWLEGVAQLLEADDVGALGSLVNPDAYARRFEALLTGGTDPLCLLPWRAKPGEIFPQRNHFWNAYLLKELRSRSEPGYVAWRAAVPLRNRRPLVTIGRADRTFIDGWHYPHGLAVSVTAWFRGRFDVQTLPSAVDDFRYKALSATWDGRPQAVNSVLSDLAEAALDIMRKRAFGNAAKGDRNGPYFVLSVISADAGPAPALPTADEAKAVAAATLRAVGAPDDGSVTPSRDLYTFARGNVVWSPDKALDTQKPHTLGCLHANVSMARLQLESLLQCAEMLNVRLDETKLCLPARVVPYALSVGRLLSRMYGGARTYAAPFVRDRIEAANKHGAIDELLFKLELPKLHVPDTK